MPISVVILTFNEGENIERCLQGLKWCDDVWVVDSNSEDDTVLIAEAAGAHVVRQPWLGFAGQRNFALTRLPLKYEWVLHLDADELVSVRLANELLNISDGSSGKKNATAFELPFQMLFMGRWLRYGGTYPNYQVRFGLKSCLSFVQVGHGQRESLAFGKLGQIKNSLYHFNFSKGIGSWISKHAVYARDEAIQAHRRGTDKTSDAEGVTFTTWMRRRIKHWTIDFPGRPLLRFFYTYLLRFGFLDGLPGLHYAVLISFYEYIVGLQRRELVHGRDAFDESTVPR
jgi:glycosyltransferase involved in cell wall biosynthesis